MRKLFLVVGLGFLPGCQTVSQWFDDTPSFSYAQDGAGKLRRGLHESGLGEERLVVFGGMSDLSASLPPAVGLTRTYHLTSQGFDAFAPLPNEPSARFAHAAASHGGKFFIWGGEDARGLMGSGGVFSFETSTWTPLPKSPMANRKFCQAVGLGDGFLVWGGRDSQGMKPDGAFYSLTSSQWKLMASHPEGKGRIGHSFLGVGHQVFVWGGYSEQALAKKGWVYDFSEDHWMPMNTKNQPSARSNHTSVATNRMLFIWGGMGPDGRLKDGGIYDIDLGAWTVFPPVPDRFAARSGHSMAAGGGKILIWGGRNSKNEFLDDGAIYDIPSGEWIYIQGQNGVGRALHTSHYWRGDFYVIGGLGRAEGMGYQYLNDIIKIRL